MKGFAFALGFVGGVVFLLNGPATYLGTSWGKNTDPKPEGLDGREQEEHLEFLSAKKRGKNKKKKQKKNKNNGVKPREDDPFHDAEGGDQEFHDVDEEDEFFDAEEEHFFEINAADEWRFEKFSDEEKQALTEKVEVMVAMKRMSGILGAFVIASEHKGNLGPIGEVMSLGGMNPLPMGDVAEKISSVFELINGLQEYFVQAKDYAGMAEEYLPNSVWVGNFSSLLQKGATRLEEFKKFQKDVTREKILQKVTNFEEYILWDSTKRRSEPIPEALRKLLLEHNVVKKEQVGMMRLEFQVNEGEKRKLQVVMEKLKFLTEVILTPERYEEHSQRVQDFLDVKGYGESAVQGVQNLFANKEVLSRAWNILQVI